MPDSFAEDLTSFVCVKTHENEDDDSKPVMIKIAEHQADPGAENRNIDGEADSVASSVSDFSMRLGRSGRCFYLMTKDLTFDKKDLSINTGKIATSHRDAACWIESTLATRIEGKIVFPRTFKDRLSKKNQLNIGEIQKIESFDNTPKHPCLSDAQDPRIRDMIILVAGCNNLTSGLKVGVGSKSCFEIISEVSGSNEAERTKSFMDLLIKHVKPKSATAE